MFLDASVIIAIITQEEGWQAYATAIAKAKKVYVSPMSRWESVVGIRRKRKCTLEDAGAAFDEFVAETTARMMTITAEIGKLAEEANDRYGMTRHAAELNFGDCFSYACAKYHNFPLLYKGNDFAKTDLA